MPDPLSRTFQALADPTRRAILARIAEGPVTVSDIVAAHDLSQPAISKHLKVLEAAGLVRRGRDARTRPCLINPEGLRAADYWIATYRPFWEAAFVRIDALLTHLPEEEIP
jgi:DNA-binding transcriptional ArsR family regulator